MVAVKYSKCFNVILLSLWIVSLFTIGLVFFTRGFLLVRIEIGNHSNINHGLDQELKRHQPVPKNKLSLTKNWLKFDKALLFIIDSLRYDFILHNPNVTSDNSKHYENKFKNLQKIISETPENGRTFKFLADPPTITVQRLKGLTTGSLPTFADARTNFGGDEILEDNLIYQFNKNNKSVVFMGDESWINLYPRQFKRELPFPGLDVKDLDTLDNSVTQHLIPEMKKNDWNVLIAHFLGVDHCGHTFGPDHPEMERKLKEMDLMLKNVIDNLDNDTVLYVLGDHGMTKTGDHGGETDDETAAALFVYSKRKIFPKDEVATKGDEVSQVDIVPTLSLQLGVPIPFANIGTVIEDLFLIEDNQTTYDSNNAREIRRNVNKMTALKINAQQVMLYLEEYSKVSKDIGEERFLKLKEIFLDAEQGFARLGLDEFILHHKDASEVLNADVLAAIKSTQNQYRQFVREVLSTCRDIWAKFDLLSMGLGFALITLTLFGCVVIVSQICSCDGVESVNELRFSLVECSGIFLNIAAWLTLACTAVSTDASLSIASLQLASLVCLVSRFWPKNKTWTNFKKHFLRRAQLDGLAMILLFIYLCSFSANSFVENEDSLLLGLTQTLLVCRIALHVADAIELNPNSDLKHFQKVSSKKRQKKKEPEFKTNWEFIFRAVILLVASICTRLSKNFWNCREEIKECEVSSFLRPMEILIYKDYLLFKVRFIFAVASVLGVFGLLYYWGKKGGHLIGNSSVYLCVKLLLPISGFCLLLHWTLKSADHKKLAPVFHLLWIQQVFFPRVVYAACLLAVVCLMWDPLGLYLIIRHRRPLQERILPGNNLNENIHAVYRDMKNRFNEKHALRSQEQELLPPLVYGLGTVYSTAFLTLIASLALVLMLLLSDAFAPSVALMLIACFCLMVDESFGNSTVQGPSFSSMITWSFMSSYWFFAVGHQATIPSIRFDAAFIGRQGDSGERFFPGLLIFLNTFAAQALWSLALPLLCVWSISKHGSASKWIPHGNENQEAKNEVGEMIIRQNSNDTTRTILTTVFTFIAIRMLKVGATAAFVAIHRRHVFIWRVFGPRFIFEAAGFLFSFPFLLVASLFFFRIDHVLQKWTIKLDDIAKTA